MHLITLSFDDGFLRSSIRTAEVFERAGLRASMNVIAAPHIAEMRAAWTDCVMGDFELWNELQSRGHDIQPHSYRHRNLGELPFNEGRSLILQCLDVFDEKLQGFDRGRSIYHFAFNRTTPELEAWLPSVVRAFRGGSCEHGINPLPTAQTRALRTTGHGPGNCEAHLDQCIDRWLAMPGGWLIYNTHGLDGEGWGPIGSDYLARLLDRLKAIASVRFVTPGEVFQRLDAGERFTVTAASR